VIFNLSSQNTVHREVQKCEVSCSLLHTFDGRRMNERQVITVRWWKDTARENRSTRRNTCPSAALYTTALSI